MYCTKCGVLNADTYINCRECGAKLRNPDGYYLDNTVMTWPNIGGKKRMRLISVMVIAIAVILSAVLPPAAFAWYQEDSFVVRISDGRFLSPENAIEFYIGALTEMDLDAALSACAVNEYAVEYDVEKVSSLIHELTPSMDSPSQYKFYKAFNQTQILGNLTFRMKYFIYSFTDSEAAKAVSIGNTYRLNDNPASEAQTFVDSVEPSFIRDLVIVSVDIPKPHLFNSETNQKSFMKMADYLGADEMTERVVLYELNGAYYYSGFQVARYGESWKIIGLVSIVGGCSVYGSAMAIAREEYEDLIS